jgi:hypothetical protein
VSCCLHGSEVSKQPQPLESRVGALTAWTSGAKSPLTQLTLSLLDRAIYSTIDTVLASTKITALNILSHLPILYCLRLDE